MDLEFFIQSLASAKPPENISVYLKALWYDAKGNWKDAHHLIQDVDDKYAAWIHAYLHRREGDISNANYWYHRAGKKMPDKSLENEWKEITTALISAQ